MEPDIAEAEFKPELSDVVVGTLTCELIVNFRFIFSHRSKL
jgi:hypothetical protein